MPDFTYLGAVILSLGMLGYYLFFYRRTAGRDRLVGAVDALREALYLDLHRRFGKETDEETASKLAAVTVNEVFGYDPEDEEYRRFKADRRSAVQTAIHRLSGDEEVRPLIAAALRLMDGPDYPADKRPPGGLARAVNLGLIDPAEKPITTQQFLARVAPYHRRQKKLA